MKDILYAQGDITEPTGLGTKIICHIVNNINKWGAGVSGAISRKWPETEQSYHSWYCNKSWAEPFGLGLVQFVLCSPDIIVANMVAQDGVYRKWENETPIKYDFLRVCLEEVAAKVAEIKESGDEVSVHMPKIGSGLARGDWKVIETLIINILCIRNIDVTIYLWWP